MLLKQILVFTLILFLPHLSIGQTVIINEVMSSNSLTIADEDGDYEDWIELYNYGSESVHLEGWGLSDDYENPFRWSFPDVTMPPGSFLLVWASGKDRTEYPGELHTNFAISSSGEEVILTLPDDTRIDELSPVAIPTDHSIGRTPDDLVNWYFFNNPTPGSANTTNAYQEILDPPAFSHTPGFFQQDFDLEITHPEPGVTIHYTLDGSEPDENSPIYNEPLTIENRSDDPNLFSNIPTNLVSSRVYEWKEPQATVEKGTVIRTIAIKDGYLQSTPAGGSYFVFPEVENRYHLPVVSIISDSTGLFGYEEGIYVAGQHGDENNHGLGNYSQRGRDWERLASFELFEPNGELVLHQNIGIRIHGGYTRRFPQKSLRLYARNDYGEQFFSYPVFGDSDPDVEYKRFILRNSGNDWYNTMFMDATAQSLIRHFNVDTQYYRPTIVFLNGEYWGIHNFRNRYDKHYLQRVYGADPDNIDLLTGKDEAKEGDNLHYNEFISYVQSNDLSVDEKMDMVNTYADLDNFLDYYSAQVYYGNSDWPQNNIDFWRSRTPFNPDAPTGLDGRWRWLLYDVDRSIGFSTQAHFDMIEWITVEENPRLAELGLEAEWPNLLLRNFLENEQFTYDFLNRIADHLNTAFEPDRVKSVIDSLRTPVEQEIEEHLERWQTPSFTAWQNNVNAMYTYADQRPDYVRQHISDHFEIDSFDNVTLDLNDNDAGYITINTTPVHPGTPGVPEDPYPWSGTYFSGIPVTLTANPADGFSFSHWSGDITQINNQNEDSPVIIINPGEDTFIKANFTETGDQDEYIHYWLFTNDLPNNTPLETITSTFSQTGGALIEYQPAISPYPPADELDTDGILDRVNDPTDINYLSELNDEIPFEDSEMRGIRARNPSLTDDAESALLFHLPSTDYGHLTFTFAAKRTGSGQREIIVEYAYDDESGWTSNGLEQSQFDVFEVWNKYSISLADIEEVNDNESFRIRIRFSGDEEIRRGTSGNVRFNNFSLHEKRESSIPIEPPEIAGTVSLGQNYPNPFNPVTTIPFQLAEQANVTLDIYDLLGRHVSRILDSSLTAGKYNFNFDASSLSSGVYIYIIDTGSEKEIKQMTLIK